jgi:hypothetical protein
LSDDQDILTGREGVEASQGWSPMVSADPVDAPDPGMTEAELAHFKRPEPPAPVEREYYNNATNEPTPENQSVTPEQAARDLGNIREQERQAKADQDAQDLRSALDQTEQPQQPTQQDQQPQPESFEPQPEAMDPEAAQAHHDAAWAEADKAIATAFENPYIRSKIEAEFNQIKTHAAATVQAAQDHYNSALSQLGQEIGVVTAAMIPEISGMSPEQARGALAVLQRTNPQRFEQITQFANRIQGAANLAQQHAHAQQQAQQQQAEMQQRQAQEAFQKYAQAEDAKAFAKETPESLAKIRNFLYADAEKAGISRAQLEQTWNSTPALRNAFTSELVADGVRWRMAQRGLAQHRANPVPQVQRPGVSSDGPRVHEGDLAAASMAFNRVGGNLGRDGLRNAAAFIAAKRGTR